MGTLDWDAFELPKGSVKINEMSLVLPSGMLIDIPGNTAPVQLSLKAADTATSVYMHVQGGFDTVHVGGRGDHAEESIERMLHKVELSTNATSSTGTQSFKLAEFQSSPTGAWSLRSEYIPPLLLVGASPFFAAYLSRMATMVYMLREVLLKEIHEDFLAASSSASGRIALRGLFAFQAMLVDLKSGVLPHPYQLFRALRDLYIDVCVHRDVQPGEIEKPYQHDDIATSFNAILERLEEQAQADQQSIPYTEFSRKDGLFTCNLGKDIRRAKDVFLLVQKPQVSGKVDMSRVKLASESRIDLVYSRALRGIPIRYLSKPPFNHGLASSMDFYSISPDQSNERQEWDYAVREGAVVFRDSEALAGSRFFLYWRNELFRRRRVISWPGVWC